MGTYGHEQVLYTDEVPKLVRKGDVFLPDKHASPLATLGLGLEVGEVLGEGQYFKVKKVYSKKLNRYFALKIFCKLRAPDEVKKKFFPREITIMKKLCHEHILGVSDILLTNRKGYMLMDYMPNGDLLDYINKQDQGHLSEPESRHLCHQIMTAVSYLHSIDVVHRDIKCSNLLLDEDYRIKLCDFGFATLCADGEMLSEACGSMGYVAPEILEGDPYEGKPTDIWSMGVVLYAMLCGRLPYHENSLDILLDSIYNPQEKLCFPKTVTTDCRSFVHAMLTPDPKKRAKLYDLKRMKWLSHPTMTSLPQKGQCLPAARDTSFDAMLNSWSNRRRQSISFDTSAEHGFSESQSAGKDDDRKTAVSDVLKAVAIRHAFGQSPTSVHKNLDTATGHGPHHFAPDTIGLKGPAARRISVQLSQTNMHLHHGQKDHATTNYQANGLQLSSGRRGSTMTSPRRASVVPRRTSIAPRRTSLAPRKACWLPDKSPSFTPSRKGSLIMLTTNSARVASLRRGSVALHCGKLQPGGSAIDLSATDVMTCAMRLNENKREHELHDLRYSLGAKVAVQAGAKRHGAAETTRRNSIFTKDMKLRKLPNALDPEEQALINSFRSKCERMKDLIA